MSLYQTHPALSARAWLRLDQISRYFDRFAPGSRVLEVGTGSGALAARLAGKYEYTGVEPDDISAERARRNITDSGRGRIVQGDITAIDGREAFDLVCAFEVLEHIADDEAALAQWTARISPGGGLLISVPAWKKRFGPSDEHVGHFRRYDPDELVHKIATVGLQAPEVTVYGFPLDFALEAVRNVAARVATRASDVDERSRASGRFLQPPPALAWATRVVTAPFRVAQRPFAKTSLGTGLIAFARKH